MRKRLGLSSSRSVRGMPLPPDLREEMKKALRRVAVDHAAKRGVIRRACKEALEAAKRERNAKLAKIEDEAGERASAIRADYDARAAKRLAENKGGK